MPYEIRELRKKQNMTQEQLAQKSGVSRTTISWLESGAKEQTTIVTLTKIANALGVTMSDVLCGR